MGSRLSTAPTQLLPALYQLPASDFHDITTGSSTGSPAYAATAGYDLATGRGTPVANQVIAALSTYTGGSQTTTAPAAPANFTAQAISTSQVSVSWSLSTGATSYNLYSKTGSSQPVLVTSYGASTTSATVGSLTAGGTYSFEIVAVNSAGTGASNWLAVTLPTNTTLAAPGNFTVKAASTTQATLSWSLSQGATGYRVYDQVAGQAVLLGTLSSTTTSTTVGNLTPGATYSFEVVAYNSTTTATTSWVSVTLPAGSTLAAPQNFTVTAASSTVANLSWSASTGATGYSVYWWNGSQAVDIGNVSAATTSVSVSGLSAGSTEKFYISAYNASSSASTSWVSVTMPAAAVLAAPQNVTATATSSTTGKLSWSASAGATGYEIYWWNGSQAVPIGSVGANTTSVNIQGMSPNSTNKFYVVAYNATSSAASGWVSLITPSTAVQTSAAQNSASQLADYAFYFSSSNERWSWS